MSCARLLVFYFFLAAALCVRQHSLKPPFSAMIPFWKTEGSAEIEEDMVLLTNGASHSAGLLYNTLPCYTRDWEVTFEISVESNRFLGGDGIAFWYTESTPTPGPMFGASSTWNGFGVVLDAKTRDRERRRPRVTVVWNSGEFSYTTGALGAEITSEPCERFRNVDATARVRVLYEGGLLSVSLAVGDAHFSEVVSRLVVDAPLGCHFAFSASTPDGSVDRQAVLSSSMISLKPHSPSPPPRAQLSAESEPVAVAGEQDGAPAAAAAAAAAPEHSPAVQAEPSQTKPLENKLEQLERRLALLMEDVEDAAGKAKANVGNALSAFEVVSDDLRGAASDAEKAATLLGRTERIAADAQAECEPQQARCKRGVGKFGTVVAVVLGLLASRAAAGALRRSRPKF